MANADLTGSDAAMGDMTTATSLAGLVFFSWTL